MSFTLNFAECGLVGVIFFYQRPFCWIKIVRNEMEVDYA